MINVFFCLVHFTQIVWRETTQMGIAYATNPEPNDDKRYISFIVANYNPRANYGDFIANVLPM